MNDAQLNLEIDRLKRARDWRSLCALYQRASRDASALEQRLFFDWERATVLATELQDGYQAVQVLVDAEEVGGPLEVIAPQVEAIRADHLQHTQLQALARATYQRWLTRDPSHDLSAELSAWLEKIPAARLSGPRPQASTPSPTLALVSQDVPPEHHQPRALLWVQLTSPNTARQGITWINQLKELIQLGGLTADEQVTLEPLLWQAAHQDQQWQLWVQLYERDFLHAPNESEPLTHRLFQLASVLEVNLKDLTRSSEMYLEVLARDTTHDEAFDRLHVLLRQQRRWGDLCHVLLTFAKQSEQTRDADDRFEMCVEAGDCYAQRLGNQAKAISAWFQALEVNPESKQVFVRLLEVYSKAQKWGAAIKVLRKLSELEEDPTKAAFHLYRIGELQRDQQNDQYLAVRSFDEALDRDPHFVKAFQAIDDTLGDHAHDLNVTERRDRYYRKMLARAVEHQLDPTLITELGIRVGELNAGPLAQWDEARRAYELALEYEPLRDEAHLGLVEIHTHLEGPAAGAERAFTWVRRVPSQPLAYLAYFERSMQAQRWDSAFCAALALESLNHVHPDVQKHLESGKELLGARLNRPLSSAEWKLLEWAQFEWGGLGDEWGEVISDLSPLLIDQLSGSKRDLKLNPKSHLVTADDSTLIGRVASYISSCLNFTLPKLWLCDTPHGEVVTPICVRGEMGLGISRTLSQRLAIEELACYLAFGLALTQPNSWFVAVPEHRDVLEALNLLLNERALTPEHQKLGSKLNQALKSLPKDKVNALKILAQRSTPLHTWRVAIEQTSYRSALLICGDVRLMRQLSQSIGTLSADTTDECFYKLLLFSVSPHYLTLRKQLQVGWSG